jgi:hypothetical protein
MPLDSRSKSLLAVLLWANPPMTSEELATHLKREYTVYSAS